MSEGSNAIVISVHIPKTAGSAFKSILAQCFGPHVCYDYGDQYKFVDVAPPTLRMRLRRAVRQLRWCRPIRGTDRCIHGHFKASKYLNRFPEHRLVTWVRDPVERVTSHYYHWKRRPDLAHSVCRQLVRDRLSLIEFADLPTMRNLQTRYLDGVSIDAFWFIGVQECFGALLPELLAAWGCESDVQPNHVENLNPAKTVDRRYPLRAETRRVLRSLNAADMDLYTAVLERLRERGPFKT